MRLNSLVLGILAFWYFGWNYLVVPAVFNERVVFEVHRGEPLDSILQRLHERDLLDHPRLDAWVLRLLHKDRELKAGRYLLIRGLPDYYTLRTLLRGSELGTRVTLQEGLTLQDIARVLARDIGVDSQAFLQAAHDSALIRKFFEEYELPGPLPPSLEGFLFPDTYYLPRGVDPEIALEILFRGFVRKVRPLLPRMDSLGISLKDAITLASIVQKEAQWRREMPIIASVYWNRLRRGMRLEADPTVLYALGRHKQRVTYRDLQVDSPYNTYRVRGLPPGPICSPGLDAIRAVLYPAETPYLYFVARPDGTHQFSRTYAEHTRAIREIRRLRAAMAAERAREQATPSGFSADTLEVPQHSGTPESLQAEPPGD